MPENIFLPVKSWMESESDSKFSDFFINTTIFNYPLLSSDRVFGCNLFSTGTFVKKLKNTLSFKTLPSLKRSRLAFNYLGGTLTTGSEATTLKVTKELKSNMESIFNAEDTLYNNGSVAHVRSWSWADISLGRVVQGTRLKISSEFDKGNGVIALDNVRVTTRQK